MNSSTLPTFENLPIHALSSVFSDTTNSYKLYWMYAILDILKQESIENQLDTKDIAIRMVSLAWYPITVFKLSFGKLDQIGKTVKHISNHITIKDDEKPIFIHLKIKELCITNKQIDQVINQLVQFVPFRFLAPFFADTLRGQIDKEKNKMIANLSENSFATLQPSIYKISLKQKVSLPARMLHEKGLLKGRILDFGCGFGKDVELLKAMGYDIIGYDPHYCPQRPTGKYDTILCFYVLNVLLQIEQAAVLLDVSYFLKPTGFAYFSVRRDIVKDGYRNHFLHQKPVYQCNTHLNYLSIFKNQNAELYQYQHYTSLNVGKTEISPFLEGSFRETFIESATVFALWDKFPLNKGHILVIPKRKISNYFDLTFREQSACWFVVNKVKTILQEMYQPNGFNIGINIEEAAGQTVSHVHIHVIPRYTGDVENPIGGIRNLFEGKGDYTKTNKN